MHFQSNTAFEIFGQSLIECSITACIHVYLQLKMSLQDSLYVLAIVQSSTQKCLAHMLHYQMLCRKWEDLQACMLLMPCSPKLLWSISHDAPDIGYEVFTGNAQPIAQAQRRMMERYCPLQNKNRHVRAVCQPTVYIPESGSWHKKYFECSLK